MAKVVGTQKLLIFYQSTKKKEKQTFEPPDPTLFPHPPPPLKRLKVVETQFL